MTHDDPAEELACVIAKKSFDTSSKIKVSLSTIYNNDTHLPQQYLHLKKVKSVSCPYYSLQQNIPIRLASVRQTHSYKSCFIVYLEFSIY